VSAQAQPPLLLLPLALLGRATLAITQGLGKLGLVVGRTLLYLPRLDRRELFRALVLFGYRSIPLTLGVATLIGATVVLQAGVYANRYGARLYTGWAAGYSVLWEFGPLLLGLVMSARIGARNAAELALLKVNGQLEGLRGISLDPFRLLVAPRLVASAISVGCLASLTFLISVLWEAIASFFMLGLPLRVFFDAFSDMLRAGDLYGGMCKSIAFGLAIAVVSTTVGLSAEQGARGVGRAAASSVVACCAAIFFLDFALTPFLARAFGQ
jgi:phospholipid/cholesterol/gamma-HCH transport system permease protein